MISFIKQKPFWLIFSIFSVVLIIFVVVLLTPSPSPATHVITWSPDSVTETISPGGSKTVNVSFTSSKDLSNVTIWAVPEIKPFVQVQPEIFPQITKEQTTNLSLIFSANQESLLGSFDGTIHLRIDSKTLARPLSVMVNIWQSVAEKGLILAYPPIWQRNTRLIEPQHPISLNTFASAYGQGGVIPKGGAEISITTVSLHTSSLSDEMTRDSIGTTVQSISDILVSGITSMRVAYIIPFTSLFTYSNIIVYVPHEAVLHKFSLLYHKGDPRETEFLTSFQQILDTVKFIK